MVRVSTRPLTSRVSLVFGVVAGLMACGLGVGLVRRAESAFGAAWAAMFLVFGVVALTSAVVSAWPMDHHRSAGLRRVVVAMLGLLAAWCAVVGVIGTAQQSWIWGPLMALPTAYLLRAVVLLLRAPRT